MPEQDEVRKRIITEAQKLFFSKGYSTVLMSELATDLGISKKTLYRYFASKEELLLAGIELYRIYTDSKVDEILVNEELEFEEKANRVFQLIGGNLHTVSTEMLSELKKNAPNAWQKIEKDNIAVSYTRINKLLAVGVKDGKIRPDLNHALASLFYICTVETMLNPDIIAHLPAQLRAEIPAKPALVFNGLLTIIMKGILK